MNLDELEKNVVCAASAYEKKYFLNPDFSKLPVYIKEELQIMSVLFTKECGGIFALYFENDELEILTKSNEDDFFYDEIFAGLLVSRLRNEKRELLEIVENFYKFKDVLNQKKQTTN